MMLVAHLNDKELSSVICKELQKITLKKKLFILFLAAWSLRCCTRAFSSCSEQGLLFIVVSGLLIAVASLVVEHGL